MDASLDVGVVFFVPLWVTVTLTFNLVSRISMSRVYIFFIIGSENIKFGVCKHLGMAECHLPLWVTVTSTMTSDLVYRLIVTGVYRQCYK